MDEINRLLIAALQENSRLTIADLGRKISLSPASTADRLRRLEEDGVIQGYHAVINPVKLGYEIRAYLFIETDRENFTRLIAHARVTPEVKELSHIEGRAAFIARVIARDLDDLKRLVNGFSEFGKTEAAQVVSTPVERHTT